jgi:acetoacetyl-CoA synthetase
VIVDPAALDGDIIWMPNPETFANTQIGRFVTFLRGRGVTLGPGYLGLWHWSVSDPDAFWALFAEFAQVHLGGLPGATRDGASMPKTRWFPGRTVNFAQHLLESRTGTALIAIEESGEARDISFDSLRAQVGALAAHLRVIGVRPGDRVVAVLPNIPEAVVGFLATAAVGATWSICAPEFGPGAIVSRFAQLEPVVLIAAPGYRLGGVDRDRRGELGQIISALPDLKQVIWVTTNVASVSTPSSTVGSVDWEQIVAIPAEPEFLDVEFSHPLWVLFSSGTTGVPKGIVHGHGGALLEVLQLLLFGGDLHPGDRYLSIASTSWVVWNSLVSAIGVGAVPVLVDGNPTYPSVDRVWALAAQTRAAVLGVGAGFVHACAKTDLVPQRDHDLSTLRCVQVTGSPLSADGFRWIYQNVGDVWLASMSGGTDIAGCFVGGAPTEPVRVGYIQVPALGAKVESWDEAGKPAKGKGELVVTEPMPSMPLQFWGDDDGARYRASYFEMYPGVWRHGDFIEFSERGIRILGRSDSTLNRSGIRLGSADIYAIVDSLPQVSESLVIGVEMGHEGYYLPLFVKLAESVSEDEGIAAIMAAIRANLSARYLPDEFIVVRGIPHTKTGKKLEVPVKRLYQGASLNQVVDLGAVDDPKLLGEYAELAAAKLRAMSGPT